METQVTVVSIPKETKIEFHQAESFVLVTNSNHSQQRKCEAVCIPSTPGRR
jgi:hypothetical protein